MAFVIMKPSDSRHAYPRTIFRVWISNGKYGHGYPVQFYEGIRTDGDILPLNWNKVVPTAKANRRGYRAHVYRKTLGLDHRESLELSRAQETACCEICGSKNEIALDHDHSSGKIRGFLCHKCNTGIGMLGELCGLRKAIAYLERKGTT